MSKNRETLIHFALQGVDKYRHGGNILAYMIYLSLSGHLTLFARNERRDKWRINLHDEESKEIFLARVERCR